MQKVLRLHFYNINNQRVKNRTITKVLQRY